METYLILITEMAKDRIHGDISVKPTQIGLCDRPRADEENYMRIMENAKMSGIFVWLDMEEPAMCPGAMRCTLTSEGT